MTERVSQGASDPFGPGRVPDELIDAVLDGSVDIERSRQLFKRLSTSPEAAREVASTQRAIDALRSPVRSPDLSGRVLGELARRHGFMTPAMRRHVWMRRVAAAAALLVVVGGAFAVQRFVPEAANLMPKATPVSDVVASVPEPTAQIAGFKTQITCGLDELASLSTLARTCSRSRSASDSAAVCEVAFEPSADEPMVTMVVLQRTAPRPEAMASLAAAERGTPTAEQFLAMPMGKADLSWAYARSARPGEAEQASAMWGAASGSARIEPMMLVVPSSGFEWVGLGHELPTRSGRATPRR